MQLSKLFSINPSTGDLIREFDEDSPVKTEAVLSLAAETFNSWKRTAQAERSGLLRKVAEVLRQNKHHYGGVITLEMGKPITQAVAEVEKCAACCDYYALNAAAFLEDEHIPTESASSYVHYEPLGVILGVMPWNFPFWQVFRFAVPAIAAGNTCLLKHASNVPQCALEIEKVFMDAGAPDGLFQALLIGSQRVEGIIADSRLRGISVTGGEKAGSRVAEAAGRNIKKVVLELGGSDPFIILGDADLKKAVQTAVKSRMNNAGQSCIAAKRFIVVEEIAAQFTNDLARAVRELKVGDPMAKTTQVGPLAGMEHLENLERQVQGSVSRGAKLITGGHRLPGKGAFFAPAVLTGVVPGMPAYSEELFGPVAVIISVKNEKEAVHVANDSAYGLGASVWTRDVRKGQSLALELESGCVFVNGLVRSDSRLPFGGVKKSGFGRELSRSGLLEFVNAKTIVVD